MTTFVRVTLAAPRQTRYLNLDHVAWLERRGEQTFVALAVQSTTATTSWLVVEEPPEAILGVLP